MADTLSITLDIAEPRLVKDRQAILVTGGVEGVLQWDMNASTDTFVDPITFTGILMPLPNTPEWMTTTTGDYKRLQKADYDVAGSDSWQEHHRLIQGNIYLTGVGTNDPVTTLQSWDKNQPFWLSFFPFGGGDNFLQIAFEFGGLGLEFYSDGTVLVYEAYTLEGSGLLVGRGSIRSLEGQEGIRIVSKGGTAANNLQGEPTDVLILPWRNRDLLVLSNRGGGFNFTFDDIDKDDPDPTISAAGVARWQVPLAQPQVLLAPVRYKQAGTLFSYLKQFRSAPASGSSPNFTVYQGNPAYDVPPTVTPALMQTDGTTAFSPDDVSTDCLLKLTLASNGKNTPFVYGGAAVFDAITANTDSSEEVVLDDFVTEIRLDVPDAPFDEKVTLTLKKSLPDGTLLTDVVPHVEKIGNRPFGITLGAAPFFIGRMSVPEREQQPVAPYKLEELPYLTWEGRGPGKPYEIYIIEDPTPFDTLALDDVVDYLARTPGYPEEEMDIEALGLILDTPSQCSNGEWSLIPQAGDKAREWLDRLFQDYAQTVIMGWYPTTLTTSGRAFRFRSPESIGTDSVATLYGTRAEALAAGHSEEFHWRHVYHSFKEIPVEIEANDIRVTGWDRRIRKLFQVHYSDEDSKAVATVPSARPENWTGEPYRVAVFDPAITTLDMAAYVLGILRARLNTSLRPAEWECELIRKDDGCPAWRGDVVTLTGQGKWRIKTLSGICDVEDPLRPRRPFHYTGEYEGPEA